MAKAYSHTDSQGLHVDQADDQNKGVPKARNPYRSLLMLRYIPVSYTHLTLPTNREV